MNPQLRAWPLVVVRAGSVHARSSKYSPDIATFLSSRPLLPLKCRSATNTFLHPTPDTISSPWEASRTPPLPSSPPSLPSSSTFPSSAITAAPPHPSVSRLGGGSTLSSSPSSSSGSSASSSPITGSPPSLSMLLVVAARNVSVAGLAVGRSVMDGDAGNAGALLRQPPAGEGGRGEVGGGDRAYLGVERQAHPQLFLEGKVAAGDEGGLAIQRDEDGVRQALVVDLLICRLPPPAGPWVFLIGMCLPMYAIHSSDKPWNLWDSFATIACISGIVIAYAVDTQLCEFVRRNEKQTWCTLGAIP
ncbi:hypothetical protein MUK42_20688 [Musa troglodytarum]|uniref:Uncharacterized protein n=1 Tax=Musa troglodytarum TaxID=320322 RepID=A0A9E7G1G5_9LILI|nr:hypothetical protein MUK42_20688 [Musa troglodytarum]